MIVFGKARLSRSPAVEGYPSGILILVASSEGVLDHPGPSSLTLAPQFVSASARVDSLPEQVGDMLPCATHCGIAASWPG